MFARQMYSNGSMLWLYLHDCPAPLFEFLCVPLTNHLMDTFTQLCLCMSKI